MAKSLVLRELVEAVWHVWNARINATITNQGDVCDALDEALASLTKAIEMYAEYWGKED